MKKTKQTFWGVTALALTGLLSACGGDIEMRDPFVPQGLVVVGDEHSYLSSTGLKYGINALKATGEPDCAANPVWVQGVAKAYGLVFQGCNSAQAPVTAQMQATPGARIADVIAQIKAVPPSGQKILSVMAGSNDFFDLYQQFNGSNAQALSAQMRQRGQQLGDAVANYMASGGKVVFAFAPNVAYSPWALAEKAQPTVAPQVAQDRQALLLDWTKSYRDGIYGVTGLLNGRHLALVTDDGVARYASSPGTYGLTSATVPACVSTAAADQCSTATLLAQATSANHLWAQAQGAGISNTLGAKFHADLGDLAVTRIRGNPF